MTYTWRVTGLRDYPTEPGAVYFASWDLSGNGGYVSGEVPLIEWLPYNELTTDVMVKWVQDAIGPEQVKKYEQSLD
jgi:hypothetical protein